jgi:hypothetical protein
LVELVTMQTVIAVVPHPDHAIVGRVVVELAVASIPVPTPLVPLAWLSASLYQISTVQLLSPLIGPQNALRVAVSSVLLTQPMSSQATAPWPWQAFSAGPSYPAYALRSENACDSH